MAEVAWFDDLCGGDTEFLTVRQPERASTYAHCREIMQTADLLGYSNILLPNSYLPGPDSVAFAAAMAPQTQRIRMLPAVRMGEMHPPMLARTLSSLDHMLEGRLTVNVISSDLPGVNEPSDVRYRRTREILEILRQAWSGDEIRFEGEFYRFDLPSDPVKPYRRGGPSLYFGGISTMAREVMAEFCDVFLMWPETEGALRETMRDVSQRAAAHGRTVDFGLRVHVIVRETESAAMDAARRLMSRFDAAEGERLKHATQDSLSAGVLRQDALRENADADGFLEPVLWGEIGRARSGCGAALVGSAEQVLDKLNRYMDMGFRSFILSGYPLIEESIHFARLVLPHLPNQPLPAASLPIA